MRNHPRSGCLRRMSGLLPLLMAFTGHAADIAQDSAQAKDAWLARHFPQPRQESTPAAGLTVLANHDAVHVNGRGGEPLRLGDREYRRGLYCHAVSKVLVTLPAPGRTFSAIIGVDNNADTRAGKSSVVFALTTGDRTLFRSDVLRVATPAVPIAVDLAGATSFLMEVGDAGDGIGWDQSDWAEAKVVLADGRELWIGDLPILVTGQATVPFSFSYGGVPAGTQISSWALKTATQEPDAERIQRTCTWTDAATGLEVRCELVDYRTFPTVEWTLHFRNTGTKDTPVIADIQALDMQLPRGDANLPVLHYFDGGYCAPQAFKPQEMVFSKENSRLELTPGGRGSDRWLPYFNLECERGGVIVAIGWPGQWRFVTGEERDNRQRVQAGQELTHCVLHPGEEIRSPLIALQFWQGGDWMAAQNVWRRWMVRHNLPTRDGKPLPPQMAGCSSHLFNEMLGANEANQIRFVTRHADEGLQLDYWWMDAGWYPNDGGWWNTGTWEVDTKRFPRGLRAISDAAHQRGVKTIVWFEPERVTRNSWLWDKHPEWLLGRDANCRLLNMGDPAARRWLTDHVDRTLTEQGIDLYRQDYNINPLGIWREQDAPDRQGVTEIRYNEGYLAYWDELRRRHPGMLIDSCASGGRRNDLETLRRSVPLLRSDDIGVPVNEQCHTYGLAFWVPYWGTGVPTTPYAFRSAMGWHLTIGPDARKPDEDYAQAVRLTRQWRAVAGHYAGDYFPLTDYTQSEHAWMAFQFHGGATPDAGMVLAYRRRLDTDSGRTLRLRGLDPAATYAFTDVDTGTETRHTGAALMRQGLLVELPQAPQAALITYRRVGE